MFNIARLKGFTNSKDGFLIEARAGVFFGQTTTYAQIALSRGPHEENYRLSTIPALSRLGGFGSCWARGDRSSVQLAFLQPLTKQEKFDYFVQHTFAMGDVLERSALVGIAQWRDSPPEWGQGLAGYGRRLGSNFGQYSITKTLQFSIGAALKEDPRYFASTENGFRKRTTHAVTHTVMVQNDSNRRVFSFGRVTGTLGGSFISRTWHPERQRTVGHALRNASVSLGTEAGWNLLREFWPDIKRMFH